MRHKKTLFALLVGLTFGLFALSLAPELKGITNRADAAVTTKTIDTTDIVGLEYSSTEFTSVDGVTYGCSGVMRSSDSGNPIQFRKLSKGAGTIYNKTAFSGITSIKLTKAGSMSEMSIYVGDSENDVSGTPQLATNTATLAFDGTHNYFTIVNGDGASYLTSIEIKYGSENAITAINITNDPDDVSYYTGQSFDPTGMEVTASYESGPDQVITDYDISPDRPLVSGDTLITVSKGGFSDTVAITVTDPTVSTLTVTTEPKNVYTVGEALDLSGMVVTASFEEGDCPDMPITAYSTSPEAGYIFTNSDFLAGSVEVFVIADQNHSILTTFLVTVTAAPASKQYTKVTNTSQLTAGSKVVFVTDSANRLMGLKKSDGTYFTAVDCVKSGDTINGLPENGLEMVVAAGSETNSFAFKGENDNYISIKSGTGKDLIYGGKSPSADSSWNVTISEGTTSIISTGTSNTNKEIRYNPDGTTRFSCYAVGHATMQRVSIYKYTSGGENITLNETSVNLAPNTNFNLTATPTEEYEPSFTWTTSNSAVVSVPSSSSATITAHTEGVGSATITCTATDGLVIRQATCSVTVVSYVHDLTEGNYMIGNSTHSTILSTKNVRNVVTGGDLDLTCSDPENTHLFTITNAFGEDNAYYIKKGDLYLGREKEDGFYLKLVDYETKWVITQPTSGIYHFKFGLGSTSNKLYYSNDTYSGVERFGISDDPLSYNYPDLTLIPAQTLSGVSLDPGHSTPTTTNYDVSDAFDSTGLVVLAHYTSFDLDVTGSVTWDPLTAGASTSVTGHITLHGNNYNVVVSGLRVTDYRVDSLSLNTDDVLTTYFVGQSLDTTGLVITATYKDHSEIGDPDRTNVNIPLSSEGLVIIPSTMQNDTTEVTVSYGGKSTSYAVTVKEKKFDLASSVTNGDHVIFVCEDYNAEMAKTSGKTFGAYEYGYHPDPLTDEGAYIFEVEKGSVNSTKAFKLISDGDNKGKYLSKDGTALAFATELDTNSSWKVNTSKYDTLFYHEVINASPDADYLKYNTSGKFTLNGENIAIYKDLTLNKPTSIQIETPATKTEFTIGETFTAAGLTIRANYQGGAFDIISFGFAVSKPDMLSAGTKTVRVIYQGAETSYTIKVTASGERTLVGMTAEDMKTLFKVGDEFTFGGKAYLVYANGDRDELNSSKYSFLGIPDPGDTFVNAKEQTVTMIYSENTTIRFEYKIYVVDESEYVDSIELTGDIKKEFNKGDDFEFGGQVIATLHYSQMSIDVTNQAHFSGFDSSKTGQQVITVSFTYGGETATDQYTINIDGEGGGGGDDDSSGSSSEHSSSEGSSSGSSSEQGQGGGIFIWGVGIGILIIAAIAIGGTVVTAGIVVGIVFIAKAAGKK